MIMKKEANVYIMVIGNFARDIKVDYGMGIS